jgi:hypothetical protein
MERRQRAHQVVALKHPEFRRGGGASVSRAGTLHHNENRPFGRADAAPADTAAVQEEEDARREFANRSDGSYFDLTISIAVSEALNPIRSQNARLSRAERRTQVISSAGAWAIRRVTNSRPMPCRWRSFATATVEM